MNKRFESGKNIQSITVGIKIKNSFSIMDSWGRIVDDILYESGDVFPKSMFTQFADLYHNHRMYNETTGEYLDISTDNIILNIAVPDKLNDAIRMLNKMLKYIAVNIISKNKLITKRIGVVIRYAASKEKIDKFKGVYFNNVSKEISDVRFSMKSLTKDSRLWQGNDNYINKIFTIEEENISYDFQVYFNPLQSDIRDVYTKVIDEAFRCFKQDVVEAI